MKRQGRDRFELTPNRTRPACLLPSSEGINRAYGPAERIGPRSVAFPAGDMMSPIGWVNTPPSRPRCA